MQSYYKGPKDVRLNSTHYFITKISNNRELQQTVINRLSDLYLHFIFYEGL